MTHASVIEKPILDLIPENVEGLRILDIAFGHGYWGYKIRVLKNGSPWLVGVDIWEPHITKQKTMNVYDEVHVVDVREGLPFPDRSFDIVLACEIVEHLEKIEACILFSEVGRVCRDLIIISTPYGFMKQDPLYWNISEKHLSGWVPRELIDRGYAVSVYDDRLMTRLPKFVDNVRRFIFGFDIPRLMVGHKRVSN